MIASPPCPGAQLVKVNGREFWSTGGKVIRFIETFGVFSNMKWTGERFVLQPWQKKLLYELFEINEATGVRRYRRALIGIPRKNGKALALDTPVPTPSGWSTMGALQVGDEVFDERGAVCRVTATSEVFTDHDCYRMRFSNGEEVIADAGHRWVTTARVDRPGVRTTSKTDLKRVRTTREIAESLRYGRRRDLNHSVAMPAPLQAAETDLPIDPWILGAWLGDGNSRCARLTVGVEDEAEMLGMVRAAGHAISPREERARGTLTVGIGVTGRNVAGSLQVELKKLNLLGNKHIPAPYLRASMVQRLALLQGLMDTDGYADARGSCEFITTRPALADGFAELLSTLGIKYARRMKQPQIGGKPAGKMATLFAFSVPVEELPVFRMARKLARQRKMPPTGCAPRSRSVQVVACDSVPSAPVRCIAVDSPTRQFLFGRTMLPTHNTELCAILALYLMLADGERSAQVYCAASSEEQADFVFEAAKRMCSMKIRDKDGNEHDAPLSSLVTVEAKKITANHDPYSFFERLSSKGSTKHGSGPHGVIFDELHAWGVGQAEELWDALNTGSAARDQPLQISITTAGTDLEESRCGGLYLHGMAVLRGEIDDPGFFFRWWQAPDDCDYRDPEMWKMASPNYGISVNANYLAGELAGTNKAEGQARGAAVSEAAFRRLYLNQWIEYGATPWITREQLKRCRVKAFLHEYQAPTWTGVDLSRSIDSTAVSWGQWIAGDERPCGHKDEPCLYVKAKTWERPRKPDGKFDDEWQVPLDDVRQFIRDLNAEFQVAVNVFDPYGSQLMVLDLEGEGLTCELMHQQGQKRSAAATGMYDLIVAERFHYDSDTLEMHILNATIKETGEDGYYLQKRRKGKIMDAAQAASHVVYGTIFEPTESSDLVFSFGGQH